MSEVGCAYEDYFNIEFNAVLPLGLKEDGYLSLDFMNKFVRAYLPVKKKIYFKKNERIKLKDFLEINVEKACVCVLGHFVYVSEGDYYSYFDNMDDPIVCIWYLE